MPPANNKASLSRNTWIALCGLILSGASIMGGGLWRLTDHFGTKLDTVGEAVISHSEKINGLQRDVDRIEKRVDRVETRVDHVEPHTAAR